MFVLNFYEICLYCLIGVLGYLIQHRVEQAKDGKIQTSIAELMFFTFLIAVLCLLVLIAVRLKSL